LQEALGGQAQASPKAQTVRPAMLSATFLSVFVSVVLAYLWHAVVISTSTSATRRACTAAAFMRVELIEIIQRQTMSRVSSITITAGTADHRAHGARLRHLTTSSMGILVSTI